MNSFDDSSKLIPATLRVGQFQLVVYTRQQLTKAELVSFGRLWLRKHGLKDFPKRGKVIVKAYKGDDFQLIE